MTMPIMDSLPKLLTAQHPEQSDQRHHGRSWRLHTKEAVTHPDKQAYDE